MSISIVAGLGNPGTVYEETRHNAGFLAIDAFAQSLNVQWQRNLKLKADYGKALIEDLSVFLVKPQSFMNLSGQVLQNFCQYYKISINNMLVIYDDITIELGRVKVSIGGSAGGHNGISDIISHCGNEFIRYRIGIGQKNHPEMDLKDHVLGKLTENEKSVLTLQFPKCINDFKYLILNGPIEGMNMINQKNKDL